MDAYLVWRDECTAAGDAYRRWTAARGTGVAFAFETYAAALNREQRACEVYAGLIRGVSDLQPQEGELVPSRPASRQITDQVDRVLTTMRTRAIDGRESDVDRHV